MEKKSKERSAFIFSMFACVSVMAVEEWHNPSLDWFLVNPSLIRPFFLPLGWIFPEKNKWSTSATAQLKAGADSSQAVGGNHVAKAVVAKQRHQQWHHGGMLGGKTVEMFAS